MNAMVNTHSLSDFSSFEVALRQTQLPGTQNRPFLREIYTLAVRRKYLETESQEKLTEAGRQSNLKEWRSGLAALNKSQKALAKAQSNCEKIYPDRIYWKKLFHPAEESLLDVACAIQKSQQLALAHLHPMTLKKKERTPWRLLFGTPSHDYPLKRLGFKAAETWFLDALDKLFDLRFKNKSVTDADRHRLIQAILQQAFSEKKELATIKVNISRIRKTRSRASVK